METPGTPATAALRSRQAHLQQGKELETEFSNQLGQKWGLDVGHDQTSVPTSKFFALDQGFFTSFLLCFSILAPFQTTLIPPFASALVSLNTPKQVFYTPEIYVVTQHNGSHTLAGRSSPNLFVRWSLDSGADCLPVGAQGAGA